MTAVTQFWGIRREMSETAETEPGQVVCVYHDRLQLKARVLNLSRE